MTATSASLERHISRLEAELAPITAKLDSHTQQFTAELATAAETWIRKELARQIDSHAEKISANGVEPLRQIKEDLAILIDGLPRASEAAVGGQGQWPHRRQPNSSPTDPRPGDFFESSFRTVVNELGALLNRHGLLTTPIGRGSSWEQTGGGGFRYVYNTGFDKRAFPSLVAYDQTLISQKKLTEERQEKRVELTKARARELWDKA